MRSYRIYIIIVSLNFILDFSLFSVKNRTYGQFGQFVHFRICTRGNWTKIKSLYGVRHFTRSIPPPGDYSAGETNELYVISEDNFLAEVIN